MASPVCDLSIPSKECTLQTCCIQQAVVEYIPTLAGNATYAALFVPLILAHIFLGVRHRTWGFLVGIFCGLVLEILGYAGRIWLHVNPFEFNAFLLYLICIGIGPAFLSASIYLCLGRVVVVYGTRLSRISPRGYAIIFVACDFVSLCLQAAGGGIAATADDDTQLKLGTHIMVAGLAFQVFSLLLFMSLCADLAIRVRKAPVKTDGPFKNLQSSRRFQSFLVGLGIATILIFVRCVFRVAELKDGFGGPLANDEVAYMILEAPMIILAVTILAICHPGVSFGGQWDAAEWSLRHKKDRGMVEKAKETTSPL